MTRCTGVGTRRWWSELTAYLCPGLHPLHQTRLDEHLAVQPSKSSLADLGQSLHPGIFEPNTRRNWQVELEDAMIFESESGCHQLYARTIICGWICNWLNEWRKPNGERRVRRAGRPIQTVHSQDRSMGYMAHWAQKTSPPLVAWLSSSPIIRPFVLLQTKGLSIRGGKDYDQGPNIQKQYVKLLDDSGGQIGKHWSRWREGEFAQMPIYKLTDIILYCYSNFLYGISYLKIVLRIFMMQWVGGERAEKKTMDFGFEILWL